MKPIFKVNDGGRSVSKRPQQMNDCTVIAVALAFKRSYDNAYDLLKELGRKSNQGFNLEEPLNEKTDWLNYNIKIHKFPAKKGEQRMTARKFAMLNSSGTFILNQ